MNCLERMIEGILHFSQSKVLNASLHLQGLCFKTESPRNWLDFCYRDAGKHIWLDFSHLQKRGRAWDRYVN